VRHGRSPAAVWLAWPVAAVCCLGSPVLAQERRDALEALERERNQLRQAEVHRRAPVLNNATDTHWLEPVPEEQPCFVIEQVRVLLPQAHVPVPAHPETGDVFPNAQPFAWLVHDLGRFESDCLGAQSLDRLRRNLDARLVQRGYVTSQVRLPPQNLATGTLWVEVLAGQLSALRWQSPDPKATPVARNAWAVIEGQVLNLRDVEQTLENLSRLPSQAAQFQIEPGEADGQSVLVVQSQGARPWRMGASLDNAAPIDYGRWQWSTQLSVDAPAHLSDLLQMQYARNLRQQGDGRAQESANLSYSLPWGYHAVNVNVSYSRNRRVVQGATLTFGERGFDRSAQWRWSWIAWRSSQARLGVFAGGAHRQARNFLEDTELVLQRRRSLRMEVGASGLWQWGQTQGSLQIEHSRSRRVSLGLEEFGLPDPALPRQWQINASLNTRLATAPLDDVAYDARLQIQYVRDAANGSDLPSIGSRFSVRGFDARQLLSGERAILLQQDWRWPIVAIGTTLSLQPYAALDAAQVRGPSTAGGAGRGLAGAALGLRGQFNRWSFDLAAATPLHAPPEFNVGQAVVYANLNVSY
jgi:hemolysin activation/secretion protein